jgi:hypothetical protein
VLAGAAVLRARAKARGSGGGEVGGAREVSGGGGQPDGIPGMLLCAKMPKPRSVPPTGEEEGLI